MARSDDLIDMIDISLDLLNAGMEVQLLSQQLSDLHR